VRPPLAPGRPRLARARRLASWSPGGRAGHRSVSPTTFPSHACIDQPPARASSVRDLVDASRPLWLWVVLHVVRAAGACEHVPVGVRLRAPVRASAVPLAPHLNTDRAPRTWAPPLNGGGAHQRGTPTPAQELGQRKERGSAPNGPI
jgi:hypothetical protein